MTREAVDRIKNAHAQGHLLAHMFEFSPEQRNCYQPSSAANFYQLFEVMHGNQAVQYSTYYHDATGGSDGFVGLPTTALHKDYPVPLYVAASSVGMLLDATDQKHVKPLMVGSSDLFSRTKEGVLQYSPHEMISELAIRQGMRAGFSEPPVQFSARNIDQMAEQARVLLPVLWNDIKARGWQAYLESQVDSPGMNEISTASQLKGVCGLIVNETKYKNGETATDRKDYANAVHKAKELRDWLHENYTSVFPEKLPIMSYNPERGKDSMIELTEEKLLMPKFPTIDFSGQSKPHDRVMSSGDYKGRA